MVSTELKIKNINALPNDYSDVSFENLRKSRALREKHRQTALTLSGNSKIVYESLTDEFTHIDIITERSGLSSSAVLSALTVLEIGELIESAEGKRYKLA